MCIETVSEGLNVARSVPKMATTLLGLRGGIPIQRHSIKFHAYWYIRYSFHFFIYTCDLIKALAETFVSSSLLSNFNRGNRSTHVNGSEKDASEEFHCVRKGGQ